MSWATVALGDVCKVIAGQSPEGKYYNNDGVGLPFYQGKKDFGKVYINPPNVWTTDVTKEAIKDDILMSVRAPVGPVNISKENICIGRGLAAIRSSEKIDKSYLFNFLLSIEKDLVGSSGAVFNSINKGQIENLEIPLPPLATQQKIVAKLDVIFAEIDKATAAAEANAKNAEALFQSYLTQVFEGKAENLVQKSLLELANEDCSLSYGIVQPGDDFENGLPIVRPTNLTKKYIPKLELKTINPVLAESYKRTTLTGEELLLCVRGTTGTVSISTEELKGFNVTRGIVPIRFKKNLIDLDYAYYLFNSSVLQKQIKSKTYGAALLQINIADVKKLKLPVPKIEEQKKIVIQLDSVKSYIDILKNSQHKKKQFLIDYKQSILKQAFNGELVKE